MPDGPRYRNDLFDAEWHILEPFFAPAAKNESTLVARPITGLSGAECPLWSPWQPLHGSWIGPGAPSTPGLYRIRRSGRDDLDYVGQTSLPLKKRLAFLRGVYGPLMPYRAPHTVGPALWALIHSTACTFEVSTASVEGEAQTRLGGATR